MWAGTFLLFPGPEVPAWIQRIWAEGGACWRIPQGDQKEQLSRGLWLTQARSTRNHPSARRHLLSSSSLCVGVSRCVVRRQASLPLSTGILLLSGKLGKQILAQSIETR